MNQNDNSMYINRLKSWLYHQRIRDSDYGNKINFYIDKYKAFYNEKKQKQINKEIERRNKFITYP